jgi:hypothetical protein
MPGTSVGVHAASSCRQRVRTGARSAAVRIHCSPRASSSAIMPWVQKPLSARTKLTRTVAGKRCERIAEEGGRPADAGRVARPQPKVRDLGTSASAATIGRWQGFRPLRV